MKVAAKYEVVRRQSGEVVGRYATRVAASRAADRKDLEYGAIGYYVRAIPSAVEVDTLAAEANPFMQD